MGDAGCWFPRYSFSNDLKKEYHANVIIEPAPTVVNNGVNFETETKISPVIIESEPPSFNIPKITDVEIVEPSVGRAETCEPFTLLIIQVNGVLLVDSIASNIGSASIESIKILGNSILKMLSGSDDTPQHSLFHWPMSQHQYAPRDEKSAKSVVIQLIEDIYQQNKFSRAILCGDVSTKYIGDYLNSSVVSVGESQVKLCVCNRLSTMLHSVDDKRAFWNALNERNLEN